MNVGPMNGVVTSAAGAPLSQTSGSEKERAQKDASVRQRQVDSEQKSEMAAGIGQTEEDQGASDRDADGRSLWKSSAEGQQEQADERHAGNSARKAKDPTGNSGGALDLTG